MQKEIHINYYTTYNFLQSVVYICKIDQFYYTYFYIQLTNCRYLNTIKHVHVVRTRSPLATATLQVCNCTACTCLDMTVNYLDIKLYNKRNEFNIKRETAEQSRLQQRSVAKLDYGHRTADYGGHSPSVLLYSSIRDLLSLIKVAEDKMDIVSSHLNMYSAIKLDFLHTCCRHSYIQSAEVHLYYNF